MTKIKVSILSIAILIIMTGAASAPVLADIARHFPEADLQLVRMVITLFLLLGFSVLSFFSNL